MNWQMNMNIKRYISILILAAMMIPLSCTDPYNHEIDESKLNYAGNIVGADNELDSWIKDNFVDPYNIEIKYRWAANESDFNKQLIPADPAKVQTIMNVAKGAWIDPYVAEAGEDFFKRFTPRQFILVGSPNYNPDGTITLGTAEAGRKIVLFSVNEFDETDRAMVKEQMHTVHHEFAHILHQTVPYPAEFKEITKGAYTADWYNIPTSVAQSRGFVTSYAMSGPDEDFVEIVAMMLTEGKRGFDRIVCSIPDATAQGYIREKQDIVVNYFANVYKIDIYSLQARTEAAIDDFAPKSILGDLGFGPGQNFYGIQIDPDELTGLPPGFLNLYNSVKANLAGQNLTLDYVLLVFIGDNELIVQFAYSDVEETQDFANFLYAMTVTGPDIVDLTQINFNTQGQTLEPYLTPLLNYFGDNTLLFAYIPNDTEDCVHDLGGIFPQGKPEINSFGTLVN
jgi:substrate import-associated zinc metallohydrolase lipoprotein